MRLYLTLGLLVLAPISLKNAIAATRTEGLAATSELHPRTVNTLINAKRKIVIPKKVHNVSMKTQTRKRSKTKPGHLANYAVKNPVHLVQQSLSKKKKTQRIKLSALRTTRVTRHNYKLALHRQIKPLRMSAVHQSRYLKARQTAIAKLMKQLGKPYVWGGTSPKTGFDCSGLIYYAYKDFLKFKIPRTANAMYHSRNAKQISRSALQRGDLVFFKINRRHVADHVGVYLGNGRFIQSPSTGKSIKITALNESYWQRHYLGARRMMTPLTIR